MEQLTTENDPRSKAFDQSRFDQRRMEQLRQSITQLQIMEQMAGTQCAEFQSELALLTAALFAVIIKCEGSDATNAKITALAVWGVSPECPTTSEHIAMMFVPAPQPDPKPKKEAAPAKANEKPRAAPKPEPARAMVTYTARDLGKRALAPGEMTAFGLGNHRYIIRICATRDEADAIIALNSLGAMTVEFPPLPLPPETSQPPQQSA